MDGRKRGRPRKDPDDLKSYEYRIRLDRGTKEKLDILSVTTGRTRADILRNAVGIAFEMWS